MDMTKYKWVAKDENEAGLIWGALHGFIGDGAPTEFGIWRNDRYFYIRDGVLCGSIEPDIYTAKRTLSTTADLVEMALRGFKDPWEVADDGYKIATVEEREKYPYPTDCEVRWYAGGWIHSINNYFWNPQEAQEEHSAFAVPADYEYKMPVVEINTDDIMRVCGDALRAEYGDNFKIAK